MIAKPLEPSGRTGRPEKLEALQPDWEELPDAAEYHNTANHQVDESAVEESRSAFITPRACRMAQRLRINPDGIPNPSESIDVQDV